MKAPSDLSASGRRLFESVTGAYLLEEHHLHLLTQACRAWDRAEGARREIGSRLTVTSRLGEVKPNPLLAVERDARGQFERLLKSLGLDIDGPPPPSARRR